MRDVLVVGATGSVGRQALDVIARSPVLRAVGLASLRNTDDLLAAATVAHCRHVAVMDDTARATVDLPESLTMHSTPAALIDACAPDIVLNASVGSAGLTWTLEAAARNIDLALSNKESLVAGGAIIARLLQASPARTVPVDSELSALHQLLTNRRGIRTLTITASGGPFRGRRWSELAGATVDEALRHPNWSMGRKNSIDSATLVNKGLELIEAHYLFDWPEQEIRVDIQRQSVLHAAVTYDDGTMLAALSPPDMRRSIGYALHHPEFVDIGLLPTTAAQLGSLEFEPSPADWPAVPLAREALGMAHRGGTAAYNAANEVAVQAFLARRISFTTIVEVIEQTLDRLPADQVDTVNGVLAVDEWAREVAAGIVAPVESAGG